MAKQNDNNTENKRPAQVPSFSLMSGICLFASFWMCAYVGSAVYFCISGVCVHSRVSGATVCGDAVHGNVKTLQGTCPQEFGRLERG